jgi:hypothetical protein
MINDIGDTKANPEAHNGCQDTEEQGVQEGTIIVAFG